MRALTLVTQEEVDRAEEELSLVLERGPGTERSDPAVPVSAPGGDPHRVSPRFARHARSAAATVGPVVAAAFVSALLSSSVPLAWLLVPAVVGMACAAWPGGLLKPALGPLAGFVAAVAGLAVSGSVELWSTTWEAAVSGAAVATFVTAVLVSLAWPPSACVEPECGT